MDLAIAHPFLYTKGGAERVVLRIAQEFDATIYVSRYEKEKAFSEFKELDVRVIPSKLRWFVPPFFPMRVRDAVIAGRQFYNYVLKEDFDVINAHGTPSQWIRNKNSPVVWYCHTPNREAFDLYDWRMSKRNIFEKAFYWAAIQPYRAIEPRIVPKLEHIFANSANTQNRLKKYLSMDSEVLSPRIDYKEFFCTGFDKFFFYPSRITPEKRFEYAIEAFKIFKKAHPGWRFVIAGALVSERKEHVSYCKRLKELLGEDGEILTDVPFNRFLDLYSSCSAVIYTPVNEDFGIIPLEAGASSKPCLSVNEGGPREVVVDGKTGYLVNSVGELADKMCFLADNLGVAEKIGEAARRHIRENFGWESFFRRFKEVCRKTTKI
ncbi:MAG: glycosyltransferase family 4 protein [Candidatus Altiarchaeota archaeon]